MTLHTNTVKFFYTEFPVKHDHARNTCFTSVQSLSCVRLLATPWTAARQASLSITNSQSLLKLMSIKLVMPSYNLILWRPLLLPPSIYPGIRVFSNESVFRIRWPMYQSFSVSSSNEYSGLISFRIDWFDLAVQGIARRLNSSVGKEYVLTLFLLNDRFFAFFLIIRLTGVNMWHMWC